MNFLGISYKFPTESLDMPALKRQIRSLHQPSLLCNGDKARIQRPRRASSQKEVRIVLGVRGCWHCSNIHRRWMGFDGWALRICFSISTKLLRCLNQDTMELWSVAWKSVSLYSKSSRYVCFVVCELLSIGTYIQTASSWMITKLVDNVISKASTITNSYNPYSIRLLETRCLYRVRTQLQM